MFITSVYYSRLSTDVEENAQAYQLLGPAARELTQLKPTSTHG